MRLIMVLAGAALVLAAGSANAVEYLTNGGFETNDGLGDLPPGWIASGNVIGLPDSNVNTFVVSPGFPAGIYSPHEGSSYVQAGPVGSPGFLSQTFSDTSGQTLQISGWAIGDTFNFPANLGSVSYFFDGNFLGSPDLSSGNWTQSVFSVVATGNDTFMVGFQNDPSYNGLDNFSVNSASLVTPLPATWTMMLLGLLGLGFAGYRKTRTGYAASANA